MNEDRRTDVLGIEDRPLPEAVYLSNVLAAREAFLAGATTPAQYERALAAAEAARDGRAA